MPCLARRQYAAAAKGAELTNAQREENLKQLLSQYEKLKKERSKEDTGVKNGRISQIMGAVVDVEFPRGHEPKLLNAIKCKHPLKENSSLDNTLTLEVAAHLPDGVVRYIVVASSPRPSTFCCFTLSLRLPYAVAFAFVPRPDLLYLFCFNSTRFWGC